ncbi:MAG TPA: hypothetical protein VJN43_06045 [Bryobacteraceae bacterium]|nr:hypothetical protein [Bryobacteraceae bacterium]
MIRDLIGRARRRYIWNEVLAQGTLAASAGMAGFILLLILGTQILDWPVLVAVSLITLAFGCYRISRRVPSNYSIAQLVDRRLLLADALSTALYFARTDAKGCASMREGQLAQAERTAQSANLERAIPFVMPRAVYALAALGLVASGLFALRYGSSRSLDLRAPLAHILMDSFGPAAQQQAANKREGARKPDVPKPVGLTIPEGDPNNAQLDPAPDSALDTTGVPDAVNDPLPQSQSNAKAKAESASTQDAEAEAGDSESSESADAATGESLSNSPEGKNANQKGASDGAKPERANADGNSSLVAKLRDAMSNLLSKMRQQQPNGSGSNHQSANGQNSRQAGSQRAGQKSNGASGEKQQAGGQETADADGQQSGAEGKNGQNSQAQGAGRSSDQQAANQPGSGIGRQDGNKDTRLAEQLAAMGKISEIIGKRSANISGEITVEVPASQQQLHTPYSQTAATHTDAGGDISRDEIPVIFQQYVQQYFEQVRKQSGQRGEPATRSKIQTPANKTQPPSM